MIIGKLNIVQFFPGLFQVVQDIGTGHTVFLAKPVNDIQTGLNLLQLIGRVAEVISAVLHLFGHISHLIHQIGNTIVEGGKAVAEPGKPAKSVLRLGQKSGGTF